MAEPSYEAGLLAAVLHSSPSPELVEALEFKFPPAVGIWNVCLLAWSRQEGTYRRLPTLVELRHYIDNYVPDPNTRGIHHTFLTAVEGANYTGYTRNELIALTTRHRALKVAAAIQAAEGQGQSIQELLPGFVAQLQQPLSLESQVEWVSLDDDTTLAQMDEEYNLAMRGCRAIPTGIRRLDSRTRMGGLWPEDLLLFLGPTGRGKTTCLVSMSLGIAEQGFTVLYFMIEGSPYDLKGRYESNFVGGEAVTRQEFAMARWKRMGNSGGQVIIPRKPLPKPWKVKHLAPAVDRYEQMAGRKADVIVVDHLDAIAPERDHRGKEHLQYKDSTESLQGYAQEHLSPVLTASQGNRAGHNAELLTMGHTAEGYNKFWAATVGLGICMTPAQKRLGTFGLSVLKHRRGKGNAGTDYVIPMCIDLDRQLIWEQPGEDIWWPVEYAKHIKLVEEQEAAS